ncbi:MULTISPECIES: toxin [unclassified Streptomyces]|uniref:toxin n=1 Tax=unclassified Streptomyces TaxID=2593676 RepID=UPI00365C90BF
MGPRAMKALLRELGREAAQDVERPAEPEAVMRAFCRAMSVRAGRPVELVFRAFPADIPVSGLRLDLGDRSLVVVEERTVPEAQLVILGHELWHEEQGDCGHRVAGLAEASARAGAPPQQTSDAVRRAAEQILAEAEVPRDALLAVAARAGSPDGHEVAAETFGLLFGREVRTWMRGRYAEGPVSPATVEGRMNLSLTSRGGRLL